MMLAGVLTKTVRDQWLAYVIGAVSIGLLLVLGMATYGTLDLSVYTSLPEAVRALMKIGAEADVATLSYGAIYGLMGALTVAGLAIWTGAGSIAGEERAGTIGLLLANPKDRTHVLVMKAGAMVGLAVVGALVLGAFAVASPALLDVSVGGMQPMALVLHMLVNGLFYGFLALAIGA